MRASKKSVTAMSASKASQITNQGYDSEAQKPPFVEGQYNMNREMFSGGY